MKPTLDVRFFVTDSGSEPVREWLKDLPAIERKVIGEDIKTVQLGWPLGMPLVRNLGDGIWEVRIKLENRIVRVLFALDKSTMVLLHGFIKKQQATPKPATVTADDLRKEALNALRGTVRGEIRTDPVQWDAIRYQIENADYLTRNAV